MSPGSGVDRISFLPENVIETILMDLPLRDAVRTSILSTIWRYRWKNIPQIVFDEKSFSLSKCRTRSDFENKMVKSIDQVLLLHGGQIHKFTLATDLNSLSDVDRWILFLSRNGIKELTLDIRNSRFYKLPSCLFSCKEITLLELHHCTIRLPERFTGFSNLTVLNLRAVKIPSENLQLLISSSPSLEELVLEEIDGIIQLRICSQKLVYFSIGAWCEELYLESAPILASASILVWDPDGEVTLKCNLIKVLGRLPSLVRLELIYPTLEVLVRGDVPVRLPMTTQLKHIVVDINFKAMKEIQSVLCVLRSSPLLKVLNIKVFSYEDAGGECEQDFWKEQDLNCSFDCLQFMEVMEFTGSKSELRFIEFVLANAPSLERVKIYLETNLNKKLGTAVGVLSELFRFRRSARAERELTQQLALSAFLLVCIMSPGSGVDRISFLPENVIENILMGLPLRDAVRTSILSRMWRYRWKNLSQIVVDQKSFPFSECQTISGCRTCRTCRTCRERRTQSDFEKKMVKSIDQVLLLHGGQIHKFTLNTYLTSLSDIDRWILFLSRNGIKELNLDIRSSRFYKLPSWLFSCKEITHLELHYSTIRLPERFTGFSNLTVLNLQLVQITVENLQLLISSSSHLEELVLKGISGCPQLRICSQKLVHFSVDVCCQELYLESAPILATASILLRDLSCVEAPIYGAECNLTKVLGHLPSLVRLELIYPTLKALVRDDVPVRLPMTTQLKHIAIGINFGAMKQILSALCVFRSSPFLKVLNIKVFSYKVAAGEYEEDFWKEQDLNGSFDCLQLMEVKNFTGTKSELRFIECVLANAPILERVKIYLETNLKGKPNTAVGVLSELLRLRRSARAEVLVAS
ncbi:hypothetical protein J5N97_005315 [Dioscorea zingiberensis]|uniref:F-box domain-containing protein n=1 Tax=Dioscorea zingiberensis TaxID=325984 RepID=A0A9D5HS84_9LILI|nr:hypothetical protein J5N97_005315 [Dioscorea zingiberensis]